MPRLGTVAVDARVLGFALAASAALGVTFGIIGSIRLLRIDPGSVLKAAAGTGVDLARHRLSNALVVGEVALSVVLLVGAGLLAATFLNLRGIRLGFDTDNILVVELSPSVAKFGSAAAGAALDRQLIERVRAIPGVSAVTTASSLPLERGPNFIFGLEGEPPEKIAYVELRAVGPDYLSTLGIPLRAGRGLVAADAERAVPVVVVNEALAKTLGGADSGAGPPRHHRARHGGGGRRARDRRRRRQRRGRTARDTPLSDDVSAANAVRERRQREHPDPDGGRRAGRRGGPRRRARRSIRNCRSRGCRRCATSRGRRSPGGASTCC